MRSYEPFDGPFFVQPLSTNQRWPLSFTHSWEEDGQYRFSPRTVVLSIDHVLSFLIAFILVFLTPLAWWQVLLAAVVIAYVVANLIRLKRGLAFGWWRKGTTPEEIRLKQEEAVARAEYNTYVTINGETDYNEWRDLYDSGKYIGLEGEDLILYIQEGIHGTA